VAKTSGKEEPKVSVKRRHRDQLEIQGPVNTAWIKARMDQLGLTGRAVASELGMGFSSFTNSLLFNPAKRQDKKNRLFKLHEIIRLAQVLNMGVVELLPYLGVHVPAQPALSNAYVQVVGSVEKDGRVVESSGLPAVSANVAPAYEALRLFGLPGLDNAVAYLGKPVAAREAVSRLCVVEHGSGKGLYFLRLGGEPGRFTLVAAFNEADRAIDVDVGNVQPVLWIRL
jgi:hypothetical protein